MSDKVMAWIVVVASIVIGFILMHLWIWPWYKKGLGI